MDKYTLTARALSRTKTLQKQDPGCIVLQAPPRLRRPLSTAIKDGLEKKGDVGSPVSVSALSNAISGVKDWNDHLTTSASDPFVINVSSAAFDESSSTATGIAISARQDEVKKTYPMAFDTFKGLHQMIEAAPTLSLEQIKMYMNTYAFAVRSVDENRNLPIHVAVNRDDPLHLLVSELLRRYPQGAQVKDKDGNLPLFAAARRPKTSVNVIKSLLAAYPEAASLKCYGSLALHHLVYTGSGAVDCIISLLAVNPLGAATPNNFGNLPLHYLCAAKSPNLEALRVLLAAYPEAITYCNKMGETPIQRALAIAKANGLARSMDLDSSGVEAVDQGLNMQEVEERVRYLLVRASQFSVLDKDQVCLLRSLHWQARKAVMMATMCPNSSCQKQQQSSVPLSKEMEFLCSLLHNHVDVWRQIIQFL
jgi:hypothetical protein